MKAVILAGGAGTRLRPLTQETPKPLVRVLDRPVLSYALAALAKLGVRRAALTCHYLADALRGYYGESAFGIRLTYFEEEAPRGTAGAVKAAQDFLDEEFLLLSGDALFDLDLQEAIDFSRSRGALATLVLARSESPLEYGVVRTDEDGKVLAFSEKPDWQGVFSDTVNTGIYVCSPALTGHIPQDTACDFSRDIFPRLLADGAALYGVTPGGYWCDIGSPASYYRCNMDALCGRVRLSLTPEGRFVGQGESRSFIADGARVLRRARLCGSVIGGGSEIHGAQILHSVLGRGVIAADGVRMDTAVLGDGCVCEENAAVFGGSVLGNRVRLSKGAHTKEGAVLAPDSTVSTREDAFSENRDRFSGDALFFVQEAQAACEQAERLGEASAAVCTAPLLVSGNGSARTTCLAQAFLQGRSRAGAPSLVMPACLFAALRFTARALGFGAAVFDEARGSEQAQVRFLDEDGLICPEQTRRALTRLLRHRPTGGAAHYGSIRTLPEQCISLYEAAQEALAPDCGALSVTLSHGTAGDALSRILARRGAHIQTGGGEEGLFLDLSEDGEDFRLYADHVLLCDAEHVRALLFSDLLARGQTRFSLPHPLPLGVEARLSAAGAKISYPLLRLPAPDSSRREAANFLPYYDAVSLACRLFAYWRELDDSFLPAPLRQALMALPSFVFLREEAKIPTDRTAAFLSRLWRRSEDPDALILKTDKGAARLLARKDAITILAESPDAEAAMELTAFAKTQISDISDLVTDLGDNTC